MTSSIAEMSGSLKSAILLLALDEDSAAEVFTFLSASEVQEISTEMARLQQVSHEDMKAVLEAFHRETEEFVALNLNSSDHIRSVLTKALGSERATSLIEDILETTGGNSGIDALNLMEASMVSELIRDEHPQIIATIWCIWIAIRPPIFSNCLRRSSATTWCYGSPPSVVSSQRHCKS